MNNLKTLAAWATFATFLGQKRVTTSKKGNVSFTFSTRLPPGESVVTATATNKATGDTSEFSNVVTAN